MSGGQRVCPKTEYIWPACDETVWSIAILFSDAAMAKWGSNAYPERWDQFCLTIPTVVGRDFR